MKSLKQIVITLASVLLFTASLIGQNIQSEGTSSVASTKNPTIFESNIFYGSPWKHSSKILYNTKQPSWGIHASCLWQTTGKNDWEVAHRYPRVGLSARYMKIGDPDTLGHALSITPTLSVHLLDRSKMNIRFDVEYGIAYLNKKFDDVENPNNNAISSSINAHVGLGFSSEFKLNNKWWLKFGTQLIHYSNGASTIPNLGINVVGASIGLKYRPTDFNISNFQKEGAKTLSQNKWGGELFLSLGYREREEARGPVYPIYLVESGLVYRATVGQHMHLGFSYEYNRGAYVFGRHILLLTDLKEARKAASRWTIYYGHEFRFGPVGLYLQLGANLSKQSKLINGNIYNKYTIRYYLPVISKPKTSFYAALTLKSYVTVAEYYSFGIGATF